MSLNEGEDVRRIRRRPRRYPERDQLRELGVRFRPSMEAEASDGEIDSRAAFGGIDWAEV